MTLSALGLRWPLRLGLRERLLLALGTALAVALGIASVASFRGQQDQILASFNRQGTTVADLLATAFEQPMARGDVAAMAAIARQVVQQRELLQVHVIDPAGRPILDQAQASGSTGRRFSAAIRIAHRSLGWVTVVVSRAPVDTTLARLRLTVIRQQIALFLVITLIQFVAISVMILKPLQRARAALGPVVPHHGPGRVTELGDLAQGITALRRRFDASLDAARQAARDARRQLDQRAAESRRMSAALGQAAATDVLTGLYALAPFERLADREVELSLRTGVATTLVLVDLDRFQELIDTLGDDAGNELLRHVARLLLGRLRKTDIVARGQGDQFFILARHMSAGQARICADALRRAFARAPFKTCDGQRPVLASFGIATSLGRHPVRTGAQLMQQAEAAMAAAKAAGRDATCHFDDLGHGLLAQYR